MLDSRRVETKERTSSTEPLLLFLDDADARDPAIAGKKAATLSRLKADGFRVPEGFVIPVAACGAVEGEESGSALPAELQRALAEALSRLGEGPVAVRSSAVAEDGSRASFAGQLETTLNVEGLAAVSRAVRSCIASARSARVREYERRAGSGGGMAVLVQRMVDAEVAGVAFSAHPVSGERQPTLVHAVRGLADELVEGLASPDEWIVRAGRVERAARSDVLDEARAREVAALAEQLETRLGAPQDVEWAIADGELHLLQARPITMLPTRPEVEVPKGSWMRDTVHYSGPMTPFGASVFLPALEHGIRSMCADFGLLMDRVEQRSLGGEVYGRPVPVGDKDGPAPPWWVMGLLVRLVPPLRKRMATARSVVRSGLLESIPERWDREWRDDYRAECERLLAVDLRSLSNDELEAHLDAALDFQRRGQWLHFHLLLPYAVPLHELVMSCKELLGWSDLEAMQLLAGLSETSSEPARALRTLADRVRQSPAARQALEGAGADLFGRLEEADPDIARQARAYRDRYCQRCAEYDSGAPTLGERPELLARLLSDAVSAEDDGSAIDGLAAERRRAEKRAREMLANLPRSDQERFEGALRRAQRTYPLREDNVFWTDNVPSGILRLAAIEIGRRLAEAGTLTHEEDVVFLEVDEARAALRGRLPDAEAQIARRRAEHAWVQTHPGPRFLGGEPAPPPDIRGLPEEARRLNGALMWLMDHEYGPPPSAGAAMTGTAASPGTYTGPVRVIRDESEFRKLERGDVLVCRVTSPVWSVLFGQAGGLIADCGSIMSHAAIVAREHAIPAVVSVDGATEKLRDGQIVTVRGSTGEVVIEDEPDSRARGQEEAS